MDWFRRTTWSDADREDFFAHLGRSRRTNRAQYLRIQAGHLQQTGDPALIRTAIELLDLMLEDYPSRIELAQAYEQRAECEAALGLKQEALRDFLAVLDAMREVPNVRVSPTGYALFVLNESLKDHYADALEALSEFGYGTFTFPLEEFRSASSAAFLEERLGRKANASEHARRALAAADRTESGYRYHRNLGLVEELPKTVRRHLERLASDTHGADGGSPIPVWRRIRKLGRRHSS